MRDDAETTLPARANPQAKGETMNMWSFLIQSKPIARWPRYCSPSEEVALQYPRLWRTMFPVCPAVLFLCCPHFTVLLRPWHAHITSMLLPCDPQVTLIVFPCSPHVSPMSLPCYPHVTPMVTNVTPMLACCYPHVTPMSHPCYPCYPHATSMFAPCHFHASPMDLHVTSMWPSGNTHVFSWYSC